MARGPEIQYIRYYTDGSAARQLEPKVPQKRRPLPKPKKRYKYTLYIQPMAIVGILLSAVLLVMMAAGYGELRNAQKQEQAMGNYVQQLKSQNAIDRAQYEETLDIEEIEKAALALGMIPQEQAQQIVISVDMPQPEEKLSFWEHTITFLESLFA